MKSFILITDESESYINDVLYSLLPLKEDEELIIFDNLSKDNTVPFFVEKMNILWIDEKHRYKFYINLEKQSYEEVLEKAKKVMKEGSTPIIIDKKERFDIEEVLKCYE